jgi:4-methylaminobutanoate oxidase (formaldehyde-forming)
MTLPTDADAVVIGAGAFGFSAAYQLAKLGASRVVVIDQYEPATQVSPKAAGLFKSIQASETKTRLSRLAMEIISGFEAETGIPMPHVRSGSIFCARTPEHGSMIDAEVEDAQSWGVEAYRIDGAEARRLTGFLEGTGLLAAYHVPGDIYIEEPKSMLMAYRQAGERLGLRVIGHTPVMGVRTANGEVQAVVTAGGEIRTPVVVDAAGVWSRRIGAMAGVDVPVQPMRHQLRITAPIAGIPADRPIVRMTDASGYVRPARGGLMVGGFEQDPLPMHPATIPGFTIDHVPVDSRVTDRFVDAMKSEIPALDGAAAQEERAGLFTMTADGRLLAGPSSQVRGFWVATGCNGSGFSLSSAVGRVIAEWIVGGQPPFDMSLLDPNRFDHHGLTDQQLLDATIWQYANYYTPLDKAA